MNRNNTMDDHPSYRKRIERIRKEEFLSFYGACDPGKWFSGRELKAFPFPERAQSLAGRYLVKKAIGDFLEQQEYMHTIEIFNDEYGKPVVIMDDRMRKCMQGKGIRKVECSLSHSQHYITGMTLFCY